MKESDELSRFKFILWVDLGYDGWHPKGFDSEESLLAGIASETYGNDYIVTMPSKVKVLVDG